MIGYQDPKQGNNKRKQLAQYLKGQTQQRAANAQQLAGGRSASTGNPFLRGGSKATPEKFAFAGMKPSMKTLLGLVGRNLGNGGVPSFNIYGPDAPVGGLSWGGAVPQAPSSSQPTFADGVPYVDPNQFMGGGNHYLGGDVKSGIGGDAVEGNLEDIWNFNAPSNPPILGDLLYGDLFQQPGLSPYAYQGLRGF